MKALKFNEQMAKAVKDGRKTQTRRPMKPQPIEESTGYFTWFSEWGLCVDTSFDNLFQQILENEYGPYKIGDTHNVDTEWKSGMVPCDGYYFVKGFAEDTPVYIRRFMASDYQCEDTEDGLLWGIDENDDPESIEVEGLNLDSIRWLDGTQIKITDIRVERLQDISEEDAISEGVVEENVIVDVKCYGDIPCEIYDYRFSGGVNFYETAEQAYESDIWNKLPYQPPYDWNSNPWVWVIEFEKVV